SDQGLGGIGGVNAEHGDGGGAFAVVVAGSLQGSDAALSHVVVVADDQLDHVAVGLAVLAQVGLHVLLSSLRAPGAVHIQLVLVGVGGVEILQSGLAGLGQNRVAVLNTVL